ncbi:MAG: glycosyltransferase family 4 protein [Verrucomicrobiota bacterium]
MRVLYFHQHFTTPQGSGGTRSYEFARALIARGHRVTMVCGKNDRDGLALPYDAKRNWSRGEIDGIDVIALPLPYSNRASLVARAVLFLKFAWRSTWLALREEYDVLFATSTPLTAGIPGIVMKLVGGRRPFVFEVRDLWPELPKALGMKNPLALGGMSILEWLSYNTSDACVGLSPGIVEGIRHRSPRGHPITMIPNGCDLELFLPGSRAELQLEGIGASDFVAAFTGAHGIANGLDAVLDAAAVLRQRGRDDIKLIFIGDGREKDRLVQRAKSEGLTNCLFFAPMKKLALARLSGRLDCGLMILANVEAFYYGTSPNKFFDYLASGIPIVNNYPGWLAQLIQTNACGVAVPPSSPEKLAEGLIALADRGREGRKQMGTNARALAEREFSREILAARFVACIEAAAVASEKNSPST